MSTTLKGVFDKQNTLNQTISSHIKDSIDAQKKQTEALQELTKTTSQRDYDHMILAIPTYDGVDPKEFDEWIERLETVAKISGRITQRISIRKI